MPKLTLKAVLPDGRVVWRTTDREYLFLVAVLWTDTHGASGWGAWRWTSRQDLADKALREARGFTTASDARIVPVVVGTAAERRRPARRAV